MDIPTPATEPAGAGGRKRRAKRRRRRQAPHHRDFLNQIRPHYDRLLEEQGGGCAICGRRPSEKRRLDIDHDHVQMRFRGLLDPRCNRALPHWITPEWLRAAADYLERPTPDWLDDILL